MAGHRHLPLAGAPLCQLLEASGAGPTTAIAGILAGAVLQEFTLGPPPVQPRGLFGFWLLLVFACCLFLRLVFGFWLLLVFACCLFLRLVFGFWLLLVFAC